MLPEESLKLLLDTGRTLGEVVRPGSFMLRPYAILPQGSGNYGIVAVPTALYAQPFSVEQTVSVYDADSFVEYFDSFADPNSRVFVDIAGQRITGILDYHTNGENAAGRWCKHVLNHVFRHTTEWTRWTANNKKQIAQADFGEFLEENSGDIIESQREAIIDLARGINATSQAVFANVQRKVGGGTSFTYSEEVNGKTVGGYDIPESFIVQIAPFEGTDKVDVLCLLRYVTDKHAKPAVTFRFNMLRLQHLMDAAVRDVQGAIQMRLQNHPFSVGVPSAVTNEAKRG